MFSVGLELGSPKNANFEKPYVMFGKDCQLFTEQNLIRLASTVVSTKSDNDVILCL